MSQTGTRYPQGVRHDGFNDISPAAARPAAIPIRELLPWVIFAGLICLLGVYFVGAEQGATSIFKGMYVHEFVHDSRHLLGFPCH